MSGMVYVPPLSRGTHDAVRLDSVGMKTVGAGSVRFVLYEVVRNEDGATGTLKLVGTLGEVTMEADGVARLDFDDGYYTYLDECVVMAVSDQAMLCAKTMNGLPATGWVSVEDGDYYTGGGAFEIPCTIGDVEAVLWMGWLIDYSIVDFTNLDELASDVNARLEALEGQSGGGDGTSVLPEVTEADNGKIVGVVNGGYGLITLASAEETSF
jgi:hypothetical protein